MTTHRFRSRVISPLWMALLWKTIPKEHIEQFFGREFWFKIVAIRVLVLMIGMILMACCISRTLSAIQIVAFSLFSIGECCGRIAQCFECFYRARRMILIRMQLQCQFFVCLFHFRIGCIFCYTQYFIVIFAAFNFPAQFQLVFGIIFWFGRTGLFWVWCCGTFTWSRLCVGRIRVFTCW